MPPQEPNPQQLTQPFLRAFLATRPAFLSITLMACAIGFATVHLNGLPIAPLTAVLTVFFALVAHAGVNVVNDYHDALNGSDAHNTERLFPFTGGSRFIQNGVLSLEQTKQLGYGLLLAVIPAGLYLTWQTGVDLVWIGGLGLFLGWAYSAPPFKLMSRGWGELAIVAGWWLVTLGTDFVQRGSFSTLPLIAGLPLALLIANILIINQFPDYKADILAGKKNWVVRLTPMGATWIYPAVAMLAYGWLLLMVGRGQLPIYAAAGAFPIALSLHASRQLQQHANQPANLAPAIKMTIAAANLHGLLISLGLWLA